MKLNLQKLLLRLVLSRNALVIILGGSLTWILTMVKSGLVYDFGMGFWGPNGHDGVWHIALAEGLSRGSWELPIFAGETIKNYHVGFDLLLAAIHKLTFIPTVNLYFQVIPPLLALGVGYSLYKLLTVWKGEREALWGLFFVYFGSGLGWLVTLVRSANLGGESMFWSQQAVSTLINPPFALSLIMIFTGFYYLVVGIKENDKKQLLFSAVIIGLIAQVKIYAAVLILGGLLVVGFLRLFQRKGTSVLRVFIGSLLISMLLTLPVLDLKSGGLEIKPFWFLETMMGFPDRFYWPRFAEALMNYRLGGIWGKYVLATLVAFFIFWYGNIGSRLFWQTYVVEKIKKKQRIDTIEQIMIFVIIAGIVIPMVVVQSGTPWNTIQFFYYSLVFSGILAGVGVATVLGRIKNRNILNLISVLIILFTIPTTVSTLKNHYLPSRPPAMISRAELKALEFLKNQPDGVVLTLPFDREAAQLAVNNPPRPLYLYESTAYVSALSGKPVYLEDEVNLNITGYDWMSRRFEADKFFYDIEEYGEKNFFGNKNIKYLYLVAPLSNFSETAGTELLFENEEVKVYKVI